MEEQSKPHVGDPVIFTDARGVDHNALVTAVYSDVCVNAVYVSGNETETDPYGRQTKRTASAMHASLQSAHGQYWRFNREEKKPVKAPIEQ